MQKTLFPALAALAMIAATPAAALAQATVYRCAFTKECATTGCAQVSYEATIRQEGARAEYGDELELWPLLVVAPLEGDGASYASPPSYGASRMITRFATGDVVMSVHFNDAGGLGAFWATGRCSEEN